MLRKVFKNLFGKNYQVMSIPVIKRPPVLNLEILTADFPDDLAKNLKEKYKHVYNSLDLRWGTMEFYSYMKTLMINEERTHREGFSVDAMLELYHLQDDHDATFPKLRMKLCNWEQNHGV
jgi:hypothetical protein